MEKVLERADAMIAEGVRRHEPLPRTELAAALAEARVMLYRGDIGETFCLAVAEAQALGVPAVVEALGSLAERVVDGVTGTVADDDAQFALFPHRELRRVIFQRLEIVQEEARAVVK